jgi:hypothetical protein
MLPIVHTGRMEPQIEHRVEHSRFEATLDGHHGWLEYRTSPEVLTIVHTEVDRALEGRGVAGALVRAAVDHAQQRGLKVAATCDYARSYLDRHPELQAMRA